MIVGGRRGRRKKAALENAWIAALLKGQHSNAASGVLLDDATGVGVGVEGVHENQRDGRSFVAIQPLPFEGRAQLLIRMQKS